MGFDTCTENLNTVFAKMVEITMSDLTSAGIARTEYQYFFCHKILMAVVTPADIIG